jgi:Fe-S cluster assembly protein SufD
MPAAPAAQLPSDAAPSAFTADAFAAHLGALGHLPQWWLDRKREAWDRFTALPLPKRTDELWRFSSVAGLTLPPRIAPPAPAALPAAAPTPGAAAELAFVNNQLSHRTPLAESWARRGVVFCPLEEAILRHADLFREHFMAQPVNLGAEKFAALNAALTAGGALLYVPAGVEIAAPLVVRHTAAGPDAAVFPHTLVILGDNAKATLVEHFLAAPPAGPGFAAGVNDLFAGPGSELTYVGTQNWSRDTLAFQLNSTVVQRDARVRSLNLHLGGRQARHESHSRLQGPGAFSEMLALTVAQGAQEFDQRTLQSHQAPHTGSNLLYKNALLDQARTIFSGLIIVDPDAQKTDAYQSNRNLLLSDEAEANSLPGLEIQANDVRCTHGATSGHVDDEQMFYLKSRGIPPAAARELLVFGFFEEVLAKLENEELHASLLTLIEAQFAGR